MYLPSTLDAVLYLKIYRADCNYTLPIQAESDEDDEDDEVDDDDDDDEDEDAWTGHDGLGTPDLMLGYCADVRLLHKSNYL